MNKPILYTTLLAAFLLTGSAYAQQTKPAAKPKTTATAKEPQKQTTAPEQARPNQITPEQRAEEITKSMIRNLELNSAQIAKVRQINLQSVQQMEAARAKHKKNPKAMVAEAEMIGKTRLSRLKDVLSDMQFQKYQRKREEEMGVAQPAAQPSRRIEAESYGE